MPVIDGLDVRVDGDIQSSIGLLISRVLEQTARLADQEINKLLLTELVEQFVASERSLAEAHAALVALSRTDALTGIANRRWFDETLERELARAIRSRARIGLLFMDIDSFKLFNDNYGHAAGDQVLTRVAQAVQAAAGRPQDLVARYGGEELACILPDTGGDGLSSVADAVLDGVRSLGIKHAFSKAADIVTLSIGGVSLIPEEGTSPRQLIEAADALLYQAKESGRNRALITT